MDLKLYATKFKLIGDVNAIHEHKTGHINKTYVVECKSASNNHRYILQRINRNVFKDIPGLMSNIAIVCEHLHKRIPDPLLDKTLTVVPTKEGQSFYKDPEGACWRVYEFVEGTVGYEVCPAIHIAAEAGATLGRFQRYLIDLDPRKLIDTIPYFHDGRKRYDALTLAIENDKHSRVAESKELIAFAKERRASLGLLVECVEQGAVPRRATHSDIKLNNILFSEHSGRGVCIVDLDTCMAGTVLYDFGDLVRNLVITAPEDELNLEKIQVDINRFRAVVEGYLGEFGKHLNQLEVDLLTAAPRVLALTLGIRFLTDYLDGDHYFRTHRSRHNYERARAQFEVVSRMEDAEPEMLEIVRSVV